MKKYLEKRLRVEGNEDVILDVPMEFEYYLVESQPDILSESPAAGNGIKSYGISITRKINETSYEEKTIRNYSECPHEARRLLERLFENKVTPASLMDVIDDELGKF